MRKMISVLVALVSIQSAFAAPEKCGSITSPGAISAALPGFWRLEKDSDSFFVGTSSVFAADTKEYLAALAAAGIKVDEIVFLKDSDSVLTVARTTDPNITLGFRTKIEAARSMRFYQGYCDKL